MRAKHDLYGVLQVRKTATGDQIRTAYKRLILLYHPDKLKSSDVEKFLTIQHAYAVLLDPHKRQIYDNECFGFEISKERAELHEKTWKNTGRPFFHKMEVSRDFFLSHQEIFTQLQLSGNAEATESGCETVIISFNSKNAYSLYKRSINAGSAALHNFFEFESAVLSKVDACWQAPTN